MGVSRRCIEPRPLRAFNANLNEINRIWAYLDGTRSDTNPRTKTRDLGPWYCRENAAMAAFLRPYGGPTCRFSTRGLVSSSRTSFCL